MLNHAAVKPKMTRRMPQKEELYFHVSVAEAVLHVTDDTSSSYILLILSITTASIRCIALRQVLLRL